MSFIIGGILPDLVKFARLPGASSVRFETRPLCFESEVQGGRRVLEIVVLR